MTIENKNNLYEIIDEKWNNNSFRSYWSYDDCKECLIRYNDIKCPINTKVFYYNEKLAYFLLSKEKLKMMRLDSHSHGKIEYQNGAFFKKYYDSSFIEGVEFLENYYGGKDFIKEQDYVKTLYDIFIEAKHNLNDFNLNIENAPISISSTNYFSVNIMERYGFCSGIIHYYTEIRKRYKDIFLKIESEALSKVNSEEYIQNIKNNKHRNNIITDVFDKNYLRHFVTKRTISNDVPKQTVFTKHAVIIAYTMCKANLNKKKCLLIINKLTNKNFESNNVLARSKYKDYKKIKKLSPEGKTRTISKNEAKNLFAAKKLIDRISKNHQDYDFGIINFDLNFVYQAETDIKDLFAKYKKKYEEIFNEKLSIETP